MSLIFTAACVSILITTLHYSENDDVAKGGAALIGAALPFAAGDKRNQEKPRKAASPIKFLCAQAASLMPSMRMLK
jgi:hypothetical protein